ncbi:hypothetical protein ACFWZ2_38710 [Streptomyces sp. NPDC059002]|uniref:hypothetical protein n=1 Tax=Streptomyces sp. NPDC059002 TaxID=3346690 RepID=UPI00368F9C4A
MGKNRAARIGFASLVLAAGALTAAGSSAAGQPAAPEPRNSCDEGGFDWDSDELYPGKEKYNPELEDSKLQMWQWHVLREDTYGVLTAGRIGVKFYIEDKKSGQKCWGKKASEEWGEEIETGVLDNRNTSIRGCIVDPDAGKECGAWLREDAGGHRQNGTGRGKLDHYPDYDRNAKANYDNHEIPGGIDVPGTTVKWGKHTKAIIKTNRGNGNPALESSGFVETSDKDMEVSLVSDKYGVGKWMKVIKTGEGKYQGYTGVLYNQHDGLMVCVRRASGPSPTYCGSWHRS